MNRAGKMIRKARVNCGVSQQGLARSIGLKSDAQISKIENGRERLALHRLRRACLILGLNYGSALRVWAQDLEQRKLKGGKQ